MKANGTPSTRQCPKCRFVYRVEIGVTFNRKATTLDGLQPWCRACDARNKHTDEHYMWTRFRATIDTEGVAHLWTKQQYFQMMGIPPAGEPDTVPPRMFRCATCGATVSDWGGGHGVDRISSKRDHIPGNCRPACWGCNHMKSNRNPESFEHEIKALVKRYGWGLIPWDEINPHIRHREDKVPDISAYIVADLQTPLAGIGT